MNSKGLGFLILALLMCATAHSQPTTRQRLARIEARRNDPVGFASVQRAASVRAAAAEGRLSLAAEADYIEGEYARGMATSGVRDGMPLQIGLDLRQDGLVRFTREPHHYVPVDRPMRVQVQGSIQHPQMTPILRPMGMTRYVRSDLGDVIPDYLIPPGRHPYYRYVGTR